MVERRSLFGAVSSSMSGSGPPDVHELLLSIDSLANRKKSPLFFVTLSKGVIYGLMMVGCMVRQILLFRINVLLQRCGVGPFNKEGVRCIPVRRREWSSSSPRDFCNTSILPRPWYSHFLIQAV